MSQRTRIISVGIAIVIVGVAGVYVLSRPRILEREVSLIECMQQARYVLIEDTRLPNASAEFASTTEKFAEVAAAYEQAILHGRRYGSTISDLYYQVTFVRADGTECAVFMTDDTFLQYGTTTIKGSFDVASPLRLDLEAGRR